MAQERDKKTRSSQDAVSAVLRFPSVTLSRQKLQEAFGRPLSRYEVSKAGGHYAQIDVPEEVGWAGLLDVLEEIGPAVLARIQSGEVGRPCADFCRFLREGEPMTSFVMSSDAAMALARAGFDIEISTYLTSSDEVP